MLALLASWLEVELDVSPADRVDAHESACSFVLLHRG